MSLCRHYVRDLRRSVLVSTPEPGDSQRSSAILQSLGDMSHHAGPSMFASEKEKDQDAQMSAFLREGRPDRPEFHDSPQSSNGPRPRPSPGISSASRDITSDSHSPAHTVARNDIRASAEKILYTFLLPGAEREIILPGSITQDVTTAIEEYARDDPEVFDVAKDYVFQAMERDAFPGFLRMKALGNLIPASLIMRLIIGLLSMFGGFWAAFVLIFLNETRITRLWVRSTSYPLPRAGPTLILPHSSFSPLPSASTSLPRISTRWTQSSPSSDTASTRPSTSPGYESPTSGSSSRSAPSWCSLSRCSSTRPSASSSFWFRANVSSAVDRPGFETPMWLCCYGPLRDDDACGRGRSGDFVSRSTSSRGASECFCFFSFLSLPLGWGG